MNGSAKKLLLRPWRDVLSFDGVTPSACANWPLSTAGAGIGGGRLTIAMMMKVPLAGRARNSGFLETSTASGNFAGSWGFMLYVGGSGSLTILLTNVGVTNYNQASRTNFLRDFGGRWVWLHMTWDGAGAPALYVSGQPQSLVLSTGGSPPGWAQPVSDTYLRAGANFVSDVWPGVLGPPILINAVLTPAEILYHAQTDQLPNWCALGSGSMADLITSNGNFDTGTPPAATGWNFNANGASTCGVVAGAGVAGSNAVVMVVDSSNGATTINRTGLQLQVGAKYRFTFTAKVDSGNGGIGSDAITFPGGPIILSTSFTTYVVEGIAVATTSSMLKRDSNSQNRTITVDNFSIQKIGPIIKPQIVPNYIKDLGANGIPGVLTVGARSARVRV